MAKYILGIYSLIFALDDFLGEKRTRALEAQWLKKSKSTISQYVTLVHRLLNSFGGFLRVSIAFSLIATLILAVILNVLKNGLSLPGWLIIILNFLFPDYPLQKMPWDTFLLWSAIMLVISLLFLAGIGASALACIAFSPDGKRKNLPFELVIARVILSIPGLDGLKCLEHEYLNKPRLREQTIFYPVILLLYFIEQKFPNVGIIDIYRKNKNPILAILVSSAYTLLIILVSIFSFLYLSVSTGLLFPILISVEIVLSFMLIFTVLCVRLVLILVALAVWVVLFSVPLLLNELGRKTGQESFIRVGKYVIAVVGFVLLTIFDL